MNTDTQTRSFSLYMVAIALSMVSFLLWSVLVSLQGDAPLVAHNAAHGSDAVYTLQVPRIGLTVPVTKPPRMYWDDQEWDLLETQMQQALLDGAVAYPHSPEPGQPGNIVIAGHSSPPNTLAADSIYGDIFAELPMLQRDDTVAIVDEFGNTVEYRIDSTAVINPEDTDILAQDDEAALTLITCYPIGSTKQRFVVHARRVSPNIAGDF